MELTIDIGNTQTKVAVFEHDRITLNRSTGRPDLKVIKAIFRNRKIDASILSSVAPVPSTLKKYLADHSYFIELNHKTSLPVKNLYRTPETLGLDRLAGAVGASFLFPKQDVLIIDLGTCIKYDFVSAKQSYYGGSISPGLMMRYKALHDYTAQLPEVRPAATSGFIGRSTRESILTGVQIGMLSEMEGFIRRYQSRYNHLKILLTGGDAKRFAGQLKLPIFAAAQLVHTGLHQILKKNVAL